MLINPVIEPLGDETRARLGGLPLGAGAARRRAAPSAHPLSRRGLDGAVIEREAAGFHAASCSTNATISTASSIRSG